MMPQFSKKSLENLNTCHPDLRRLFLSVVNRFDCTVLCGIRGEADQNEAFRTKYSKLRFPDSKHNQRPSLAVDVAPYPIDWENRERFHYFAGQVMIAAYWMGLDIRWGGDWDGDNKLNGNDLPHYELIGEEYVVSGKSA